MIGDRIASARFCRDSDLTCSVMALIEPLMRGLPEQVGFDYRLIAGEATTNAQKYGRGEAVECRAVVRHYPDTPDPAIPGQDPAIPGQISGMAGILLRYRSERFDTCPAEPDLLAEHGRGIWLIRTLAEQGGGRSCWRFRADTLTVVAIKRW